MQNLLEETALYNSFFHLFLLTLKLILMHVGWHSIKISYFCIVVHPHKGDEISPVQCIGPEIIGEIVTSETYAECAYTGAQQIF